jgi:hypothetical protein
MSNKIKFSSSTMNVSGVITPVSFTQWAELRLTPDELERFRYDISSIEKIVEVGVADGTILMVRVCEDDIETYTFEFPYTITVPEEIKFWMKKMQADPEIITFRDVEFL